MNINLTLVSQAIAFAAFIWFVVKFVWPPLINAIESRQKTIADGLAAADRARADMDAGHKRLDMEFAAARAQTSERLAEAEKRALAILEEARVRANAEGANIIEAARIEAENQVVKAREALREQVAILAVKGAEQILTREVNAAVHADLLGRLKAEL